MKKWNILDNEEQLKSIVEESYQTPVAIFKHSTTCGISHSAKSKLDSQFVKLSEDIKLYYLDLLSYRSVSNAVVRELGVMHQSPQIIILKDGEVIHTSSHYAIQPKVVLSKVAS